MLSDIVSWPCSSSSMLWFSIHPSPFLSSLVPTSFTSWILLLTPSSRTSSPRLLPSSILYFWRCYAILIRCLASLILPSSLSINITCRSWPKSSLWWILSPLSSPERRVLLPLFHLSNVPLYCLVFFWSRWPFWVCFLLIELDALDYSELKYPLHTYTTSKVQNDHTSLSPSSPKPPTYSLLPLFSLVTYELFSMNDV